MGTIVHAHASANRGALFAVSVFVLAFQLIGSFVDELLLVCFCRNGVCFGARSAVVLAVCMAAW